MWRAPVARLGLTQLGVQSEGSTVFPAWFRQAANRARFSSSVPHLPSHHGYNPSSRAANGGFAAPHEEPVLLHAHKSVMHVPMFSRMDVHYKRKKLIEEYPMPYEATNFFGHQDTTYCNTFLQELSPYQRKNIWPWWIQNWGRWWFRFSVTWWLWVWPLFSLLILFELGSYRCQKVQRNRTWH